MLQRHRYGDPRVRSLGDGDPRVRRHMSGREVTSRPALRVQTARRRDARIGGRKKTFRRRRFLAPKDLHRPRLDRYSNTDQRPPGADMEIERIISFDKHTIVCTSMDFLGDTTVHTHTRRPTQLHSIEAGDFHQDKLLTSAARQRRIFRG